MALDRDTVPEDKTLFGMTTQFEQQHYKTLAREMDGVGEVVDLGCWLGSTTISLARGLAQNPHPAARQRKIYAFDRFRWEPYMREVVQGTSLEAQFGVKRSFIKEYKKRIAPWSKRVVIREGDLLAEHWVGAPIEILLVDAMKSPELANRIWEQFYPSLIPGKSVVVHQDFGHFSVWWIHLLQYWLRDYFSIVEQVQASSTVTFRLEGPLPSNLIGSRWPFDEVAEAEIDTAFAYWMEQIHERNILNHIAAAHVIAHMQHNRRARGEQISAQYFQQGFSLSAYRAFERERLEEYRVLRPPRVARAQSSRTKTIPSALERGLEFLTRHQDRNGHFLLAPLEETTPAPFFHAAPFATMHILHALENVSGATPIIESGLDYLQTNSIDGKLWRMWAHANAAQQNDARYQIPADVDSTALISLLMHRHNKTVPDNKQQILKLRNARHVFKTWFTPSDPVPFLPAFCKQAIRRRDKKLISRFWKTSGADPQATDVIVNAHVLLYLGVRPETYTVLNWMSWAALQNQEWAENRLYRDVFTFYDALSQNIYAGALSLSRLCPAIVKRLEGFAGPNGKVGEHELHTALALNTLRNFDIDSGLIEPALNYLLETQAPEGGWPALPFLWTQHGALAWGSEALTTAFCVRALACYQGERGL